MDSVYSCCVGFSQTPLYEEVEEDSDKWERRMNI
jgi:hypothetical protein